MNNLNNRDYEIIEWFHNLSHSERIRWLQTFQEMQINNHINNDNDDTIVRAENLQNYNNNNYNNNNENNRSEPSDLLTNTD